jgi:hypothetical protein
MVRFGVVFGLMFSLAMPMTATVDEEDGDDPPGELEESKAEKEKDAKELELERDGDTFVSPEARLYGSDAQSFAAPSSAQRAASRGSHGCYEARGPPA